MSKIQSGCGTDCMNCKDSSCSKRIVDIVVEEEDIQKENKVTETKEEIENGNN